MSENIPHSSDLRNLTILNWSPRVRVREEINPRPHAPRQHEPPDWKQEHLAMPLISRDRTASTPATLKGSLNSLACTQTIDQIVKESARRDRFHPSTRPAGATRPKESETPAACSLAKFGDDKTTPVRVVKDLRALRKPDFASDSSVAFRFGAVTSDKGHGNAKFAEVKKLLRNIHEKIR
jgi:hypothetical protein